MSVFCSQAISNQICSQPEQKVIVILHQVLRWKQVNYPAIGELSNMSPFWKMRKVLKILINIVKQNIGAKGEGRCTLITVFVF